MQVYEENRIPSYPIKAMNVSRETFDDLCRFVELLKKWQKVKNLISRKDQDNIWNRHVMDCLQLYDVSRETSKWLDLGSGAGFPGLILAICHKKNREAQITLIESNQRKCAFLRDVVRKLELPAEILNMRIESVSKDSLPAFQAISSRALTDLSTLFFYINELMDPEKVAYFHKGKGYKQEEMEARKKWGFNLEPIQSKIDSEGLILKITDLERIMG